ncbi:MAG: adenosylmethionine decarboxylase [bacterium]
MEIPGVQLIAELADCDITLLDDETALKRVLFEGIIACGMANVKITSHKFSPVGVTAIAIISESHIAIHTYPEACHASIDIFHCSEDRDSLFDLLNYFKVKFHPKSVSFVVLSRGKKLRIIHDDISAIDSPDQNKPFP